jgi:hypothetical protein
VLENHVKYRLGIVSVAVGCYRVRAYGFTPQIIFSYHKKNYKTFCGERKDAKNYEQNRSPQLEVLKGKIERKNIVIISNSLQQNRC